MDKKGAEFCGGLGKRKDIRLPGNWSPDGKEKLFRRSKKKVGGGVVNNYDLWGP